MKLYKGEIRGMQVTIINVEDMKDLKKAGVDPDTLKPDPSCIWWTIHHADDDWTCPSWVKKGIGAVNRMAFMAAPEALYKVCEDENWMPVAIFGTEAEEDREMEVLREILESEGEEYAGKI